MMLSRGNEILSYSKTAVNIGFYIMELELRFLICGQTPDDGPEVYEVRCRFFSAH